MSRAAPQHLVVPCTKNTTWSVSIRGVETYTAGSASRAGMLFHELSTAFPPLSDRNSTGFCTGEKRVIPSKIRRFSAPFATSFRAYFHQRWRNAFSSTFSLLPSGRNSNEKGEKEAESAACGKTAESTRGRVGGMECTGNVARGTFCRLCVQLAALRSTKGFFLATGSGTAHGGGMRLCPSRPEETRAPKSVPLRAASCEL